MQVGTQAVAPKAKVAEQLPTAELAGNSDGFPVAVILHTCALHEVTDPDVTAQVPEVADPVPAVHVEENVVPVAP